MALRVGAVDMSSSRLFQSTVVFGKCEIFPVVHSRVSQFKSRAKVVLQDRKV